LTAKLRPCHHSLPDDQPVDIRTDGLDLAGDLEPKRHGRFGVAGYKPTLAILNHDT
jgi:hypothetical protein